jgi:hypothetical protein
MPSRPVVAAILAFWLATAGYAFYRDVWPRLISSGPPPLLIDLADEASQFSAGIDWTLYRGDQKVGRLTTRTTYRDEDDTFLFTHKYKQVQFDFGTARVQVPELVTTTRVTRSGELREQAMEGMLKVQLAAGGAGFVDLAAARAKVEGRAEGGRFVGRCELVSPLGNVSRDLDPVPVPAGQALNPLQPVNRLDRVHPGRRWVIYTFDPLAEALAALGRGQLGGLGLPEHRREPLIAEVLPSPQPLDRKGGPVPCWVIEYRNGDTKARTWVRVSDGRVLRQEASGFGERVAIDRDEVDTP